MQNIARHCARKPDDRAGVSGNLHKNPPPQPSVAHQFSPTHVSDFAKRAATFLADFSSFLTFFAISPTQLPHRIFKKKSRERGSMMKIKIAISFLEVKRKRNIRLKKRVSCYNF